VQTTEEQIEEAAEHFTTSAELFDVLNQPRKSVEAGIYLGRTLLSQGKTAEAAQALDAAEERLNTVFEQSNQEDVRLRTEINTLKQTLNAN
jgi:uncharacterized membrane-anchored protein YhcB (DUF1043 family)